MVDVAANTQKRNSAQSFGYMAVLIAALIQYF